MKIATLVWIGVLCVMLARAAATPAPPAGLPWPAWFEKNTSVSDKGTYVHILWDANAVRTRFEGKGERAFVAEAGRQLVSLRYPKNATADPVRIDIVFVTERDEYGNPKWDTLQRVAHLECSRKALSQTAGADAEKGFQKLEIFR